MFIKFFESNGTLRHLLWLVDIMKKLDTEGHHRPKQFGKLQFKQI